MLSIKVWLELVNLVGEVTLGRRLVEYMMSRKSKTFLFESHFRRSILKSPSNKTALFSLINFSERGFRYSLLNSPCCYMDVYKCILLQCFWSPSGLFQEESSLFYKPLNLVLVYS